MAESTADRLWRAVLAALLALLLVGVAIGYAQSRAACRAREGALVRGVWWFECVAPARGG